MLMMIIINFMMLVFIINFMIIILNNCGDIGGCVCIFLILIKLYLKILKVVRKSSFIVKNLFFRYL